MRRVLKVALRGLLGLLFVGVLLGTVGGAMWLGDWAHNRYHVENITYDPDRRYTPDELQEDFRVFRGALEESHGGLYWYTPKAEFGAAFEAAFERLGEPMTELEFVKVVAPLVDLIRDGHTQLRLPPYYLDLVDTSELPLWPLDLVVTKAGTYVERDGSGEGVVPPGSELLTLNGQPINEVANDLLTLFVTADGYADRAKLRTLYDRSFFALYYGYLHGFPGAFEVTYVEPDSEEVQRATLRALTLSESDANMTERYGETPDMSPTGVDLAWRGEVPVLTVSAFYRGEFDDYADALEDAFAEVRRR